MNDAQKKDILLQKMFYEQGNLLVTCYSNVLFKKINYKRIESIKGMKSRTSIFYWVILASVFT